MGELRKVVVVALLQVFILLGILLFTTLFSFGFLFCLADLRLC